MPYFLLERVDDGVGVGDHRRRIERDGAFFLGAVDQPLGAVGAGIGGDVGDGLRAGGRSDAQQADDHKRSQHRFRPRYLYLSLKGGG